MYIYFFIGTKRPEVYSFKVSIFRKITLGLQLIKEEQIKVCKKILILLMQYNKKILLYFFCKIVLLFGRNKNVSLKMKTCIAPIVRVLGDLGCLKAIGQIQVMASARVMSSPLVANQTLLEASLNGLGRMLRLELAASSQKCADSSSVDRFQFV